MCAMIAVYHQMKLNKQHICGIQATSLIHARNSDVSQRMTYFISTFYIIFDVVLILRVKKKIQKR